MSVILNEAAITKLFNAPEGPVARFVGKVAGEVRDAGAKFIDQYYESAETLHVGDDLTVEMDGSTALVHLVPDPDTSGEKAERVAKVQVLGTWPWLTKARDEVKAQRGR